MRYDKWFLLAACFRVGTTFDRLWNEKGQDGRKVEVEKALEENLS